MGFTGFQVLNMFVFTAVIVILISTQTTANETTTVVPDIDCTEKNSTCDDCVQYSSCYYCFKDHKCRPYPSGLHTLQPQKDCGTLGDMAWKTCIVKFNTLLIILGSTGGAILLALLICCCCCCRKVNRIKVQRQMNKWERQRNERQAAAEERRQDREQKREEMRQKYGLSAIGNNNKYKRFD